MKVSQVSLKQYTKKVCTVHTILETGRFFVFAIWERLKLLNCNFISLKKDFNLFNFHNLFCFIYVQ